MPLRPLLSRDTARGPEAQGGASEQSSLFTLTARGGGGVWGGRTGKQPGMKRLGIAGNSLIFQGEGIKT